jgi:ABC-type Na+ transport system ATPase subunit NatA
LAIAASQPSAPRSHEIYTQIRELADEGRVVLFRSTELPELVGLADQILVFYRGRLAFDIDAATVDDRGVLHAINTGTLIDPAVATGQAGSPGQDESDGEGGVR